MDRAGGYDEYGWIADLYDHVIPYRDRPDVAFFVDLAREAKGPVLEIGCGTGRVLIPTARAGAAIVGLDASPGMLAVCREKLAREPAEVRGRARLVEADMRDFAVPERFALATIPFRPFQHLTEVAEQVSCLRAIHRHLRPGGRLVLDIFDPNMAFLVDEGRSREFGHEPEFTMPDGRRVVRTHRIAERDLANQRFTGELAYHVTHPDGRKENLYHRFPMRYLFRTEGEHLLARCGYEVETVYSDYDRTPHGEKYPRELIFVARRA